MNAGFSLASHLRAAVLAILAIPFLCGTVRAQQENPTDRNLAIAAESAGTAGNSRTALVIGNSAYKAGAPLANPVNDARDIAKTLSGLGFAVTLKENATQREMKQAVREFASRIRRGGVGLVYFAGHGIQSRGRNYLIPVDADIRQEFELEDQGVDANLILGAMDEAQNAVNVLILDACRNNPFARSFRSASNGLVQMDAAKGTLIAYATAPSSVAADGTGRNGIYTKHLLLSLQHPDSDIGKVFARVRSGVVKETGGRQVPWESTSLIGDFYFRRGETGVPSQTETEREPVRLSPLALEISYWESIQNSRIKADFQSYLSRFPRGQYEDLAKNRIDSLSNESPAATHASAPQGMATVLFFRPNGFVGWGATSVVTVKGREVGQLRNGSYFVAKVPSGTQTVAVDHGEWAGTRVFDFEPGANYYIKFEYSLGKVSLRAVKEAEATEAIRELPDTSDAAVKR